MDFFKNFSSNTIASSANQLIFGMNDGEIRTGRVYYKISNSGRYNYSFLFSNVLDSTYNDGEVSSCNFVCDSWKILSAGVAVCAKDFIPENFTKNDVANNLNCRDISFSPLTFQGETEKSVAPGEFFSSDAISLDCNKGDYLCFEITFSGTILPHHYESLLPVFIKTDAGWVYDRSMPLPGMVGCDRPVKKRVAFVGDSITQGIGTAPNSYRHWTALLTEALSNENAYWNLGIGFARASDFGSNGAWAFKAKQNDVVFICLGVNDIFQKKESEVISSLAKAVNFLNKSGVKVVLQTVPPYDTDSPQIYTNINNYIKSNLAPKVDLVFDVCSILKSTDGGINKKFFADGCHPSEEGCKVWAEELLKTINSSHIFN